ncbi:MAG TPA: hypothetical protein VGM06_00960 [Polyangiaceae bacterium]
MNDTTTVIIVLLIGVAAIALIAVAASRQSRSRRAALKRRFGPEYDRAVLFFGNPAHAERDLAARERRMARFHLRDIDDVTRQRFATAWTAVQARFIDDPAQAVVAANDLIKEVMLAIGYPADEFEQRTKDLSVAHPNVVQHYRAAHLLAESNQAGHADTEELRQAVVHYRALFTELVEQKAAPQSERALRALHA